MRAALVILAALTFAAPASAAPIANHCVKLGSHGRFYLKPTRLGGHYMLVGTDGKLEGADAPGPAAEWTIKRVRGGRFSVRNTHAGRPPRAPPRLRRAPPRPPLPPAAPGARGKPR